MEMEVTSPDKNVSAFVEREGETEDRLLFFLFSGEKRRGDGLLL
jgi:hypothetical protein